MKFFLYILMILFFTGCSTGYEIDGKKVVYSTWDEGYGKRSKLLDADPDSFEVLGNDNLYAKDRDKVFFMGYEVPGMNAIAFKIINDYFGTDGIKISVGCVVISSIDSQNFYVFEPSLYNEKNINKYATDQKAVYWYSHRDKCGYVGFVTKYTDKFKVLSNKFSVDEKNVYYGDQVLKMANPNFFKLLNQNYAIDNSNVFYKGKIIKDADINTFKALNSDEAVDKNNKYKFEKPL